MKGFIYKWRGCWKKAGFLNTGIKKGALFFIFIYQTCFSVFFGGACRFYPSCSEYAKLCVLRSLPLSLIIRRLLKCHFFGCFGIDEVPCIRLGKKEQKQPKHAPSPASLEYTRRL